MLPDPLHPAVVHFPIVLMFLVPISALVAFRAISRGASPLKAWSVPLAFAAALSLSAWVSLQTGQGQEERVERVVSERRIGAHEEAAELFLTFTGALAVVMAAGLLKGRAGQVARVAGAVGSLAVITAGYQVGRSGGELVYTYGAASAYTAGDVGGGPVGEQGSRRGVDDENGPGER